jgi:endonuclease YncB( thermonuclease family)
MPETAGITPQQVRVEQIRPGDTLTLSDHPQPTTVINLTGAGGVYELRIADAHELAAGGSAARQALRDSVRATLPADHMVTRISRTGRYG